MERCGALGMACCISSYLLTDLGEVTQGNWEKDIRCFKLMPEKIQRKQILLAAAQSRQSLGVACGL